MALLLGLGFAVVGCSRIPPHPEIEDPDQGFSGAVVAAHLESLEGLRPRSPGSDADITAREYLARELALAGARVEELEEGGRRHLLATLDGRSSDRILLVAAYPALPSAEWVDDASLATLLELARVCGRAPNAYTLEFGLAETRPDPAPTASDPAAPDATGGESGWMPVASSREARRQITAAGASFARAVASKGRIDGLRAVIGFDLSARSGLRIARDLRSQPVFRDVFWRSAADLGFERTFPEGADWASPDSLHLGFRDQSMDRVLALVDVDWMEPPGASASGRSEAAAVESLEPVGRVTAAALGRLMRRFAKVDAFAR